MLVPGLQHRHGGGGRHRARRPDVPQQGIALLERLGIVHLHPGPPRLPGHQQGVQEGPAPRRITLHQGQVLRGEQHRPQGAQDVPGPRHRGAPQLRPVGAAGVDLQLQHRLAAVVVHCPADDGVLRPHPHQWLVGTHAVRAQGREIARGLHQVGLALTIAPHEHGHPGRQVQVRLLVGAEVTDRQVAQSHASAADTQALTPRRRRLPGWPRPGCPRAPPPGGPAWDGPRARRRRS